MGNAGYSATESIIKNCYNTGEIKGNIKNPENNIDIGGIVGLQYSNISISNIYNVGKITINADGILNAGGISGFMTSGVGTNIYNIYNIGILEIKNTSGVNNVGSVIGNAPQKILNNCYYLKGTYDIGVGSETVTGVIELDNIEDFPTVLSIVNEENVFKEDKNKINNGYPILEWQ